MYVSIRSEFGFVWIRQMTVRIESVISSGYVLRIELNLCGRVRII